MITAPRAVYRRVLPLLATLCEEAEFRGRLPGIHLEGPFISAKEGAVGAHHAPSVCDASISYFEELQGWARGHVRIITIAAEAEGAAELTRHCAALNPPVCVSIGHQVATAADVTRLAAAGCAAATHLGNGLPNMIHRHDNPIWPVLADPRITAFVITDGHHLPRDFIATTVAAKGAQGVLVTSDIVHLGGLPPGDYVGSEAGLGGDEIVRVEEGGKVHMPRRKCLAGSGSTMLQCMNHLHSLRLCSLTRRELTRTVCFDNALRLLGDAAAEQVRARARELGPMLRFTDAGGFALLSPPVDD